MKLSAIYTGEPTIRQAINRSGKHVVRIRGQADYSPYPRVRYSIDVENSPGKNDFLQVHEVDTVAEVEGYLEQPGNNPPTDDLDPKAWELLG